MYNVLAFRIECNVSFNSHHGLAILTDKPLQVRFQYNKQRYQSLLLQIYIDLNNAFN